MKIKKYASGGVYTGFTPSIPKTTGTTTTKNSGSSGSSKSPDLPFTKELMEMLAAKGLPSDNTVFSNELAQILYRAQISGADMPAHITVAFANKANTMAEMKSDFDKAYDKVIEKGTGNDIATHGQFMYVEDLSKPEDEREMTLITPSQYLESPKQWKILTNQDILHARKYDVNFAFNASTIVSDAASSVNLTMIRDRWREETKALATQSNSGTLRQDVQMQDYITGASILQKANGDVDSSTTLRNEHVQSYLSFLYTSMDEKSKGYLHNYLATKGIEASGQNILEFMYENIVDYVATSTKYSPEAKGSGKGSGSGSGSDISGVTEDNQAIRVQRGAGVPESIVIKPKPSAPGKAAAAFTAQGYNYGNFLDYSDNPITGNISVKELSEKAIVFAATTRGINSAYLGIKHLSEWDLSQILWKHGPIHVAQLPAKSESDGSIRPWFELLDAISSANSGQLRTRFEVEEYLKKKGIPITALKYNKDNHKYELNIETSQFLIVQGYAGTDTLSLSDEQKRYVENVSEAVAERFEDIANGLLGDIGMFEQNNESDDFVAGNIYIPIDQNPYPAISGTMNFYHNKSDFNPNYGLEVQAGWTYDAIQDDPDRKELKTNFSE